MFGWSPNLSSLVQNPIPEKFGKKRGIQRRRVSRTAEERDVATLDDPLEDVEPFPNSQLLRLTWLKGTRITTCYGCGNKFRSSRHDPVPPEPYDVVVIGTKQIRAYTPRGATGISFSTKPENVYFHLKKSCVLVQCSNTISKDNFIVYDDEKLKIKFSHQNMLRKEFGIDL